MSATIFFAYLYQNVLAGTGIKALVLNWFFYCFFSTVQAVNSLAALVVLNVQLADNFDRPYLATSVEEFWAKRWNLVMGTELREMVYEPIIQSMSARSIPAVYVECREMDCWR